MTLFIYCEMAEEAGLDNSSYRTQQIRSWGRSLVVHKNLSFTCPGVVAQLDSETHGTPWSLALQLVVTVLQISDSH